MVKKIISVATAFLMLCCMIPFGAFADDVLDVCPKCGERTYSTWRDLSVEVADALGMPLSIKAKSCSNCGYAYYDWNLFGVTGYKDYANGGTSLIIDYLREWIDKTFGKNATATEWTAGGGSTDGSGVGRHPSGYADDNGTPIYNANGELQIIVYPRLGFDSSNDVQDYPANIQKNKDGSVWKVDGLAVTGRSTYSGSTDSVNVYFSYSFTSPVSGTFYLSTKQMYVKHRLSGIPNSFDNPSVPAGKFSQHLMKGNVGYVLSSSLIFRCNFLGGENDTVTSHFLPLVLNVVPDTTTIKNYNNITINNNTWNGNIYTDNSTNLTYIYPKYTTINENNETVTNISNNPIIYNNTTNQYYTYDTVTNNYYYITYEEPKPSATPAPTWTPGGGSTRGGGVGRNPSDTDAADWTLHYYILNNRRYDAYYALKKTEVNSETKLPWVDNKKYISTTQIPIANGQYTVSVPDGVVRHEVA